VTEILYREDHCIFTWDFVSRGSQTIFEKKCEIETLAMSSGSRTTVWKWRSWPCREDHDHSFFFMKDAWNFEFLFAWKCENAYINCLRMHIWKFFRMHECVKFWVCIYLMHGTIWENAFMSAWDFVFQLLMHVWMHIQMYEIPFLFIFWMRMHVWMHQTSFFITFFYENAHTNVSESMKCM